METALELFFALAVVFFAAELFTNAVEHLGERLGISEGVAGSIFAAIGTAMPETIVPIVAIVAGGASKAVNEEVGLGAILGAPFMLATIALGLVALSAIWKRGRSAVLRPEITGLRRDLWSFLGFFGVALFAGLLPPEERALRVAVAIGLVFGYLLYLLATLRASQQLVAQGHGVEADEPLFFARWLGRDGIGWILAQLLLALGVLVFGARLFVHGVEQASELLGVSPLVVSLLLVPIATELPEKVNSILWIREGKDTLALGNITGAMVFQGSLIPAIGMLIMPWQLHDWREWLPAGLALFGALFLLGMARKERIRAEGLLVHLGLYAVFVAVVVWLA